MQAVYIKSMRGEPLREERLLESGKETCVDKGRSTKTQHSMNESVHGVTPDRDRGRLCAAVIVERANISRAKSIRGKGEVPWTVNQAGVLLDTRLRSL